MHGHLIYFSWSIFQFVIFFPDADSGRLQCVCMQMAQISKGKKKTKKDFEISMPMY